MNNKAFLLLIAVVLALGTSLGVAFAGGMALGKSQGEQAALASLPNQSTSNLSGSSTSQFNPETLQQLREQFQGGDLSREELQQLREQFQGGGFGGGGRDRGGMLQGGGLVGTIEKIEGTTVTMGTLQGPLQATIVEATAIQRIAEGVLADLQEGQAVRITGERGEDGTLQAQTVLLLPEDGSFAERSSLGQDRQP